MIKKKEVEKLEKIICSFEKSYEIKKDLKIATEFFNNILSDFGYENLVLPMVKTLTS